MSENSVKGAERSLYLALPIVVCVVIVLAIVGFIFIKPADDVLQGEVEATTVRVSGIMPGRVAELYVEEGTSVMMGDTLARIHSNTVDAKLMQAEAMRSAAKAQNQRVDAGARSQVITSANELWQQAKAAKEITEKTSKRMNTLYDKGVVTAQKRDEAEAAFKAASAAASAAKAQYEMALEGATAEDKLGAEAMLAAAESTVKEVESILDDQYLIAPCDGEIVDVYPNVGELVSVGTPIMSVMKSDDMWVTFNVREAMLKDLTMNKRINVTVPALGDKGIDVEIFYIRDMGSYAVWTATKAVGDYDSKTFRIKARPTEAVESLRPGMSILLTEDK